MSGAKAEMEIRPMTVEDIDAILFIDRKIRGVGKAVTYEYLTTEHILTIDRHLRPSVKPTSYADLIKGDVSELLEYSFVAETEGHVRGFILGRTTRVGEAGTPTGNILILGVHPNYWRKGIATELVAAICDKYHSKGIRTVRTEVDQRDKQLLGFVEHMGFSVGHRIEYSKTL